MTPIPLRDHLSGAIGRRPAVPAERRRRSPVLGVALRELVRAVSWHRRLVAGVLAGIAVLAALQTLRPAAAAGVPVVTAAHDLPAGAILGRGDLRVATLPVGLAPAGSSASVAGIVGARLASPLRSGEAVTDVRLLGPAVLAAYQATVGPDAGELILPVDAATVAVLHPGDRVDVLAAPTAGPGAGGPTVTVAADVPVLAVPGAGGAASSGPLGTGGSGSGSSTAGSETGSVLVVVTPATARLIAQAAVSAQISILVHPD